MAFHVTGFICFYLEENLANIYFEQLHLLLLLAEKYFSFVFEPDFGMGCQFYFTFVRFLRPIDSDNLSRIFKRASTLDQE